MYCGKDSFENVFNVADEIMIRKDKYNTNTRLLHEVKLQVQSLGDSELLNDFIYQNYNSSINYFDDDMEKTAIFLDTLSRSDCTDKYIKRTQNYEMMSTQYLPAYSFRKYCAGIRNGKTEYPKDLRNVRYEKKRFDSIIDQLMDLDSVHFSKRGIQKVKKD